MPIALAKQLLSQPSITPNDHGCQDIIATRLVALGFKIEWHNHGNTKNLYARIGSQSPVLCFAGHTDVVPTGDTANGHSPPLSQPNTTANSTPAAQPT